MNADRRVLTDDTGFGTYRRRHPGSYSRGGRAAVPPNRLSQDQGRRHRQGAKDELSQRLSLLRIEEGDPSGGGSLADGRGRVGRPADRGQALSGTAAFSLTAYLNQ